MLANLKRVGDKTDGGGIEDDVVVVFTEQLYYLSEILTGQEFRGVRRHGTCQQQVEVVVDARCLYLFAKGFLRHLLKGQQRGDALEAVGNTEQATQGRFADVETTKDDLLAKQGERHGKVGGIERLTLTGSAGGEANHLLVTL